MSQRLSSEKKWEIKMTNFAMKTDNPLRKIWEEVSLLPNPKKDVITLQIGEK